MDSSTTVAPRFRLLPTVLAADSMQERSGSFDLVTGAQDCDYDEVGVSDLFRVICEGDVLVVIRPGEPLDLASVHVKADRRQVSWRHCRVRAGVRRSQKTGNAAGFVFQSMIHLKPLDNVF